MALRLHVGTHHAVAHDGLAVFAQEGRNDGVKRPLARRHLVDAGLQAKAVAAVLQADTELRLHTARAKAHVVALNEADHHAVFVSGREVNGAALDRVTRTEVLRLCHVDQLGPAGQVGIVQHLLCRHFHGSGLSDVFVDIGKSQFHGFDLQVLRIHAIDLQAGHIKFIQNAQRNQRRNALPVGRNLVQGVAAVIAAYGLDPLRLVGRKIFGCEAAAVLFGEFF